MRAQRATPLHHERSAFACDIGYTDPDGAGAAFGARGFHEEIVAILSLNAIEARAICEQVALGSFVMPFVSSDPHAWLYPIYARLRADTRFGLLSPSHQFEALTSAVEKQSLSKGASMREWRPDAQMAMLKWLGDVTQEHPHSTNEIELWRVVRQGERELRCVVIYLPSGIDVRLFEGADFRRTQLVRDAVESTAVSDGWKRRLEERDWRLVGDG